MCEQNDQNAKCTKGTFDMYNNYSCLTLVTLHTTNCGFVILVIKI